MIDEFTAYPRSEILCPEADFHAFARWQKIESAILRGDGRAVIGHRRCLVGDPWLIKIVSYRVDDPLAVLIRAERVAADRQFLGYQFLMVYFCWFSSDSKVMGLV